MLQLFMTSHVCSRKKFSCCIKRSAIASVQSRSKKLRAQQNFSLLVLLLGLHTSRFLLTTTTPSYRGNSSCRTALIASIKSVPTMSAATCDGQRSTSKALPPCLTHELTLSLKSGRIAFIQLRACSSERGLSDEGEHVQICAIEVCVRAGGASEMAETVRAHLNVSFRRFRLFSYSRYRCRTETYQVWSE